MTNKSPSAVNPSNFTFVPGVDYAVRAQSMLFSYNAGSLFMAGQPATPQQLVPTLAQAVVYLRRECLSSIERGYYSAARRRVEQHTELQEHMRDLRICRDVAQMVADNTPSR